MKSFLSHGEKLPFQPWLASLSSNGVTIKIPHGVVVLLHHIASQSWQCHERTRSKPIQILTEYEAEV